MLGFLSVESTVHSDESGSDNDGREDNVKADFKAANDRYDCEKKDGSEEDEEDLHSAANSVPRGQLQSQSVIEMENAASSLSVSA